FASFLFVKKGRARPGLRGKPAPAETPCGGHPLKTTLSHQNKIEKAPHYKTRARASRQAVPAHTSRKGQQNLCGKITLQLIVESIKFSTMS
ncbi:MAG: hypothetical protein ACLSWS_16430, partial [Faecalispora jeddahensis]